MFFRPPFEPIGEEVSYRSRVSGVPDDTAGRSEGEAGPVPGGNDGNAALTFNDRLLCCYYDSILPSCYSLTMAPYLDDVDLTLLAVFKRVPSKMLGRSGYLEDGYG